MARTSLSKDWVLLAALGVAIVHGLFVWLAPQAPIASDALFYHDAAIRIAQGFGYTAAATGEAQTAFMPGYPVFVAFFYRLFGIHPQLIRLVQCALIAATAYLMYKTVARWSSPRVAAITFVLLATMPALFIYPDTLNAETLVIVLVAALLWMLSFETIADLPWSIICALIVSLITLIKPEFCLWLPVPAIVAFCRSASAKRSVRIFGYSLLTFVLLLTPWIVRNERAFHRFIPFATKAGAALYISGHAPPITEFQDPLYVAEAARCEVAGDPKATDNCMRKDALAEIAQHKLYFLKTSLVRVAHTLVGSHTEYLPGYTAALSDARRDHLTKVVIVKVTLLIVNGIFVALGLLGLLWIGWSRRFAFLIYMVGSKLAIHGLLFGTPRYGLHLSPIFAFTGAAMLMKLFRREETRS